MAEVKEERNILSPVVIEVEGRRYIFPHPISIQLGCLSGIDYNGIIHFEVKVEALSVNTEVLPKEET